LSDILLKKGDDLTKISISYNKSKGVTFNEISKK
jgi:hypothetical protein